MIKSGLEQMNPSDFEKDNPISDLIDWRYNITMSFTK